MSKVKLAKAIYNGQVICEEVELANNWYRRLMGLMFRKAMAQSHGLLLDPCNSIHTFNMKFNIDTIYLDKNYEIIKLDEDIPKGKVRPIVKNAKMVLEINSGLIEKYQLQLGEKVSIIEKNE